MNKKMLIGLSGCLALFACHGPAAHDHAEEGHDHAAEVAEHAPQAGHTDEIILPAEKARAAGVATEVVEPGTFREVIATSGRILPAPGDETVVVANVAGVVHFPRTVSEGSAVKKETPLLVIASAHLQDGDPVQRARVAYETARAEYERAQKLVDDKIVSQKEFESLRAAYETARIAYEAFAQDAEAGGTAVKAPTDGYIKRCTVREGDYVSVGQPLMTLTQNRRLYLRADVAERHYPALGRIASANFRTPAGDRILRLSELGGRMVAYGRNADDASAYIPVTFSFDNRGDLLPGSFAEVWLLGTPREGVVSLPLSALTEEQGVYSVYVQLDEEGYRKQVVTPGASDGERVEILTGLSGGERVVTQGAIHVKLAAASNAIPAHTHNH